MWGWRLKSRLSAIPPVAENQKHVFKRHVVSCLTGKWGYWEGVVLVLGKGGSIPEDNEPWYYNKSWQDDPLWHHSCSAQWAHWASWSCFPAVNNIRTAETAWQHQWHQWKEWFSECVINETTLPPQQYEMWWKSGNVNSSPKAKPLSVFTHSHVFFFQTCNFCWKQKEKLWKMSMFLFSIQ